MRYCRRCDLFTGYGALGVFQKPENADEEWIRTHCWCCGAHERDCDPAP